MSAELWASAEQSATRSEKRTWWRDARTTMTIDTPARDESEKITVPLATRTLEQETWSILPALVLEELVVNLGGIEPSHLGPPESYRSSK